MMITSTNLFIYLAFVGKLVSFVHYIVVGNNISFVSSELGNLSNMERLDFCESVLLSPPAFVRMFFIFSSFHEQSLHAPFIVMPDLNSVSYLPPEVGNLQKLIYLDMGKRVTLLSVFI